MAEANFQNEYGREKLPRSVRFAHGRDGQTRRTSAKRVVLLLRFTFGSLLIATNF